MFVRKFFSENMASWVDIPEDLTKILANDEVEAAYPVLVDSGVL